MTTTYYMSITVSATDDKDVDNSGTSSTATDIIELRVGNGTYAPDRAETIKALKRFERWIMQGGLKGLGANIPLPTGSG